MRTPLVFGLSLGLLFLAGCGSDSKSLSPKDVVPEKHPVAQELPPAERQAAETFAKQIESTLQAGDPSLMKSSTDLGAMVDKACQGMKVNAAMRSGMRTGTAKSDLSVELVNILKEGGSYTLLRVSKVGNETCALFRLLCADGAVNYHDLYLTQAPTGETKISDFYIFATGERMSETLRRLILTLIPLDNSTNWKEVLGTEKDFAANAMKFKAFIETIRQKNFTKAMELYKALPKDLQEDKLVMISRIQATMNGPEADYLASLTEFKRIYPTCNAAELLMIDYYFLKKEYKEAIKAAETLNQAVIDPYMMGLIGSLYHQDGQHQKGLDIVKRALDKEPTLKNLYHFALDISLGQNLHAETAAILTRYNKHMPDGPLDMESHEPAAEFIKTPEYQAYKAQLEKP